MPCQRQRFDIKRQASVKVHHKYYYRYRATETMHINATSINNACNERKGRLVCTRIKLPRNKATTRGHRFTLIGTVFQFRSASGTKTQNKVRELMISENQSIYQTVAAVRRQTSKFTVNRSRLINHKNKLHDNCLATWVFVTSC
jgi:hypothetical protein